jgi:hypothetical protein
MYYLAPMCSVLHRQYSSVSLRIEIRTVDCQINFRSDRLRSCCRKGKCHFLKQLNCGKRLVADGRWSGAGRRIDSASPKC